MRERDISQDVCREVEECQEDKSFDTQRFNARISGIRQMIRLLTRKGGSNLSAWHRSCASAVEAPLFQGVACCSDTPFGCRACAIQLHVGQEASA